MKKKLDIGRLVVVVVHGRVDGALLRQVAERLPTGEQSMWQQLA